MKKVIKFIFISFLIIQMGVVVFGQTTQASTVSELSNQYLVNVGQNAGFDTTRNIDIKTSIAGIINIALSFVGLFFLVLITYGGIKWMTSAGNEKTIADAKSMLTAAVIGLIITLLAWSISFFILQSLQNQGFGR